MIARGDVADMRSYVQIVGDELAQALGKDCTRNLSRLFLHADAARLQVSFSVDGNAATVTEYVGVHLHTALSAAIRRRGGKVGARRSLTQLLHRVEELGLPFDFSARVI